MTTLNLGILAHVDAGKTSLTERLLYAAGVIDEVGSVDAGSTQTDSLALERQRGITIKAAVVSFPIDDVTVNLIDTPGHPDFIAEVERVLSVLDGAVLVVSAVEGVQAQTRVLMRALKRLEIPTLIFVNKIDRRGADPDRVLANIAERLTPAVVPMGDLAGASRIVEQLAERNDQFLRAYVDGARLGDDVIRRELAAQTRRALVHPVFAGSAITGAGTPELTRGIASLLPARTGDVDGPVSGTVFKVERGSAGEKVAYVRLFSGTVHTRERLPFGDGHEGKVTGINVFAQGSVPQRSEVSAGEIGKLTGLAEIQIGDAVGLPASNAPRQQFSPPTLETVVVPRERSEKGRLHTALAQLAEQDPLINLRQDDVRNELYLSLYGEVQKEVIEATLASEYGVAVEFRETTTICVERPSGCGAAVDFMGDDDNPYRATVGLRVAPLPVGSGVRFGLEVELGSLPYSFIRATEETVRKTLAQGLHGWQVTDIEVLMTHSGFTPPPPYGFSKWSSTAGDFRHLTPLVLMDALAEAGVRVYEPTHRFFLEIPGDALGPIQPLLGRLGAVPLSQDLRGAVAVVEGLIPAAQVDSLQRQLPELTHGEGVLESSFDHYDPVRGALPSRPRTDHNPLDRRQYLRVVKRVMRQGLEG
ncbi:TetM/TetW/TetO/TetS family tetracycline resistance ribosomal protection protein [Tenggerimyces flavus]|uniref:TetM/TetW/TetO/TetS family tetracycline resistance ribosomal protection protein n=1 Tax=Tenggerimyces flavus TaxID=1708749 RepID=A0ABV7YDU0_9ACTN|nr:TetM/TetW/TetO/TetS family tetracycline resistance ribosomal protection protein [Tenggerimyces flavus]MBM7789086.1 ribosomal protection tetracycline resistance protein [Tenggerimyces flavus]